MGEAVKETPAIQTSQVVHVLLTKLVHVLSDITDEVMSLCANT